MKRAEWTDKWSLDVTLYGLAAGMSGEFNQFWKGGRDLVHTHWIHIFHVRAKRSNSR